MEEKALQPIVINGKTLMEADGKFTADGIELIRKTVAIGATDLELQMLLYLAQAYKLDPFLKEIIFIKRKVWNDYKKAYNEVPSYLVPRDGHLAIAHRGGQFDGMETVALHDKEKGTLMGAKCTVYNKSMAHPITVSVLFSEYCVKGKDGKAQALWATKPETMIKKVAEAQALRKAFNIKGMYIPEEMEAEAIKDAAGEIEHMAESIKTAEAIHSTKVNYDEWATDTITHILESLETCKTEQDVWRVEKAYAEDIKTMVDKDREYVLAMIDSAKEECIRGDRDEIPTAEAVAKVNNELEERGGVSTLPQGENVQPGASGAEIQPESEESQKISPQLDTKALEEAQAFGKKWIPQAIKEIKACTTKAQMKVWTANNRQNVLKTLEDGREYLRSIYTEHYRKLTE